VKKSKPVMVARISDLVALPRGGMTTAATLDCCFCGRSISGMGGPGCCTLCEPCARAITDPWSDLGRFYRDAIYDAKKALAQKCAAEGKELPEWL